MFQIREQSSFLNVLYIQQCFKKMKVYITKADPGIFNGEGGANTFSRRKTAAPGRPHTGALFLQNNGAHSLCFFKNKRGAPPLKSALDNKSRVTDPCRLPPSDEEACLSRSPYINKIHLTCLCSKTKPVFVS